MALRQFDRRARRTDRSHRRLGRWLQHSSSTTGPYAQIDLTGRRPPASCRDRWLRPPGLTHLPRLTRLPRVNLTSGGTRWLQGNAKHQKPGPMPHAAAYLHPRSLAKEIRSNQVSPPMQMAPYTCMTRTELEQWKQPSKRIFAWLEPSWDNENHHPNVFHWVGTVKPTIQTYFRT